MNHSAQFGRRSIATTMKLKTISLACALALALVLSACGGGSVGGSTPVLVTPPPVTPPPVTPPPVISPPVTPPPEPPPPVVPPVVVTPPTYTFNPEALETSYVAGYPVVVELTGKPTVPFVGVAYVKVTADGDVIDPTVAVTGLPDGNITVKFKTSTTAKPGTYAGNFTVNVCLDANCAGHLTGSPFKLPYSVEVFAPEGGVQNFNTTALAALAGAPDWGTFQSNAGHTGYVPVTLDPSAFKARWKLTAPSSGGIQYTLSTIATGGGRLYVTNGNFFNSAGTSITAYSEADGSKLWSHSFRDLTTPGTQPPAYSNGRVFTAAGAQESTAMFGFDAASGVQLFKTQMSSQWENYLAPTVFNGNVYTEGGTYGGLYSFAGVTGAQNYFMRVDQYDGWTPAVDTQNLYSYMAGALRIHDPLTGQVRSIINDPLYSWNGYSTASAPVIGGGGIVYAGNLSNAMDNAIIAFDTVNKSVRWSAKGGFAGNPAYADGYLFADNNVTGKLEVRRESDGVIEWSWAAPTTQPIFASDVLLTQNLVFVSTISTTYAIDRVSHVAVWSYKAAGKLALSANGILYIKAKSGIVAIDLK
jgi:hypothetical protein